MPSCPRRKSESEPGSERCRNCGEPLAESAEAPLAGSAEAPLVVVYEAPTQMLADRVKSVLAEAGLPIAEQVDRTYWYDGIDFSMKGRYSRLFATEGRAQEAKRVVDEFLAALERGEFALEGDESSEEESDE